MASATANLNLKMTLALRITLHRFFLHQRDCGPLIGQMQIVEVQ